jgi:hypothetical protein
MHSHAGMRFDSNSAGPGVGQGGEEGGWQIEQMDQLNPSPSLVTLLGGGRGTRGEVWINLTP